MPPIIKNLLILNGLLFLAQFVAAETLARASLLAQVLSFSIRRAFRNPCLSEEEARRGFGRGSS